MVQQPNPTEIKVHDRANLAQLFQNIDFPATQAEVMRRVGKVELLWTQTEPITLDDVLRQIPPSGFATLDDLCDAICSVIRLAYGENRPEDGTPIIMP